MKKFLALGLVGLVLINLTGCQFNIFTAFDKIDIPGASNLLEKAESNPKGFVSDVQEYLDSDSITEDNAAGIVAALVVVYASVGGDIGEQAAILAGEIIIDNNPDTKNVVDSIVSSVTDALDSGEELDPEALLEGIFSSGMTQSEFSDILAVLSTAADAYKNFAASIDSNPTDGVADVGAADWMSSAEAGDMVQYAIVAIIITDLNSTVDIDVLYDSVINGTDIPDGDYTDPFDGDELSALLNFAGLEL